MSKMVLGVLHVKRWSGDIDGKQIDSLKLTLISDESDNTTDSKGIKIVEYRTDYMNYAKLSKVPGMYELDLVLNQKGVVVKDICKYIGPILPDLLKASEF